MPITLRDVAGDEVDAEHAGAGERHRDRHADQQRSEQNDQGQRAVSRTLG